MDKSLLHRIMLSCAEDGHSMFAPSYSATWMNCAGSLVPSLLEDDECSWEAAEGTVAHGLAEEWLRTGEPPLRILDTTVVHHEYGEDYEIPVTQDMFDYLEEYVVRCQGRPGDHYIETKVYFSELMPIGNPDASELNDEDTTPVPFIPQGGTADHIACSPGKLFITDLKYGQNVYVEAEGNTQLLIYALAVFNKYDHLYNFNEIYIQVVQRHRTIIISTGLTREQIKEFEQQVIKAASRAWQINAPRTPSLKSCQWCRISYKCPGVLVMMIRIIRGEFDRINDEIGPEEMEEAKRVLREELEGTLGDSSVLTTDEKSVIYSQRKLIEKWFKDLEKNLEQLVSSGVRLPGLKRVNTRPSRKFKSDGKAIEVLSLVDVETEDIYKTEMLSPSQIETVLKQKKYGLDKKSIEALLKPITIHVSNGSKIVRSDEPGKDLDENYADVFDD